jgi:hypothetical protein
VWLEGLGELKKKSTDLIGNRNRNLPAYSIVPHPNTIPRAPVFPKYQKSLSVRKYMHGNMQRTGDGCVYCPEIDNTLFQMHAENSSFQSYLLSVLLIIGV